MPGSHKLTFLPLAVAGVARVLLKGQPGHVVLWVTQVHKVLRAYKGEMALQGHLVVQDSQEHRDLLVYKE